MISTRHRRWEAEKWAKSPAESFFARHRWKEEAQHLAEVEEWAQGRFEELVGHERKGLAARRKDLEATKPELESGTRTP